MILEELELLYGPYIAEMVRQSMTLEDFHRLDVDEVVPYFSLRSARAYQEYVAQEGKEPKGMTSAPSNDVYLDVLRRRWQQAEELAQLVLNAERDIKERQEMAVGF